MSKTLITMLAIFSLVGAACGAPQGASPVRTEAPDQTGTLPEGPSALGDPTNSAFPEPLVDPSQIISGGPPPEGIPPVDDPAFVPISEA
ncbi:MAG: hypothetical protein ACRD02_12020, partial [Acidimicrobiia bacterium]